MTPDGANGGFPEPPAARPVREVRCSHEECGHETRIRLPTELPAEVVRRVVCDGCGRAYEPRSVAPAPARSRWLAGPPGRLWWLASIPIATAAVIGALLLIQELDGDRAADSTVETGAGESGPAREDARLVRAPTYTLALPPGWERVDPPSGATFGARSDDGTGDSALFIERDADLDFAAFEARSLRRLEDLAGSAEVTDRVAGPTLEQTIVTLGSEPAGDRPTYEVTLRASGPYRYYLSTTLQPDALQDAREGADLIHSSFLPGP
jgi:hypothetical protein